jgi:hypothetical protein
VADRLDQHDLEQPLEDQRSSRTIRRGLVADQFGDTAQSRRACLARVDLGNSWQQALQQNGIVAIEGEMSAKQPCCA